ncbi:MAG: peptidoglycan DD-metalloendopeptidase family protein [Acidimicrobiales bacterium]|nr:peptidoglycan DD-metalloendopeptidase family protein [Acidimicrobiales bacterium]
MPHRAVRSAVVAVVLGLLVGLLAPTPTGAAPPPYLPPVEAAVVDGFRPPTTPYGPGNRGLEYATAPGTDVRAAADGRVTFAGNVAGTRHVTLLHADGLRTTYSFLAEIAVVTGQEVHQGDVVGRTAGRLHFSARAGDSYLDPAALFGGGPPKVRLVPFDEPPGAGPSGERSAIRQLLGGTVGLGAALGSAVGGAVEGAVDAGTALAGSAVDQTAAWLGSKAQLLRTIAHYAQRFAPVLATIDRVRTAIDIVRTAWQVAHRQCTDPDVVAEPPVERRVALLVAGLGSTSEGAAVDDVDVGALGYEPADVLRFSYAGGRTATAASGELSRIPSTTYDAATSQGDLRESGRRLADLVEDVAARAEGAPIDLVAHSQGGIVVRLALLELEARHGASWLDRVGLVATLGTPHGGADAATALHALSKTLPGRMTLDVVDDSGLLAISAKAPSAAQLGETSDVIEQLADRPLPVGVDAISIAARGDLIVPVPRTELDGAPQVVVPLLGPTAHDRLPGSPEAQQELAFALAGRPPRCRSFGDALSDQLVGEGISLGEDAAGAFAWGLTARPALAPR